MREIVSRLKQAYPDSRCSLDHRNSFELLVATVLSAQCPDARVNMVTPALFERFPTPAAMAEATQDEMEELLRTVNFYRNKSKALIGLARVLRDEYDSEVPHELDQLTALPGVGRKTANVVRGVAWGYADGVVVDTHVKRIVKRWGFTRHSDPDKVEKDLLKLLPPEERVAFTHHVIDHGREVCVARKPRCEVCVFTDVCPSAFKFD